jgi:riboflavin synthase
MFTGIIKEIGVVKAVRRDKQNFSLTIESNLSSELSIDQSIAHNGVCLTVVAIDRALKQYEVVAVKETLDKTNVGSLRTGSLVNLELAMVLNAKLDGHMVQGHVDEVIQCIEKRDQQGSWLFTFESQSLNGELIIEKGSVAVNGVSLTSFDVGSNRFSVAVIPYTYAHTGFHVMELGDEVNLEYDLIGKYVARQLSAFKRPA